MLFICAVDLTTLSRVPQGQRKEIAGPTAADGITTLAFSPDSQWLAAGFGAGDTGVHVWDLKTDTETRLAGHSGWITGLAFSRNGQTVASASTGQTLRLWDLTGNTEPRRLQGHTDEVWTLAWSSDGQNLVTGGNLLNRGAASSDRRFVPKLWRVDGWQEISLQGINLEQLYEADCSPTEKTLAISYRDGTVVWWDLATGQRQTEFDSQYSHAVQVAFSPDGNTLFAASLEGTALLWRAPSWEEIEAAENKKKCP